MANEQSPRKSPGGSLLRGGRIVTIGSGITEKKVKRYSMKALFKVNPEDWKAQFAGRQDNFPYGYARAARSVTWARNVLEEAGLPPDPVQTYPSPKPRGGKCTLLQLVEQRGKKEDHAPEWFAAKILECWHEATKARSAIERGAETLVPRALRWHLSQLARNMGEFGETIERSEMKFRWEAAVLAHRRSCEGARRGGSKKKMLEGVELFLEDRLRGKPNVSAGELWIETTLFTPFAPRIKDGKGGYSIYRAGGRLCQGSDDESIEFEAFRKYVSRVKARLIKEGK
jgi:hypothetical protein